MSPSPAFGYGATKPSADGAARRPYPNTARRQVVKSLVAERATIWRQSLLERRQRFFIAPPASDRFLVNRTGDFKVVGGEDKLFSRGFVVLGLLRHPRQSEKFRDPPAFDRRV